jgi:hypothetical protein
MQTFTIYPKGKGEPFNLECERFEVKDEHFILYNSYNIESQEAFLSFTEVAAIIPDQKKSRYGAKIIKFLVYLKDRSQPVEIFSSIFKTDNSQVVFITQQKDMIGNVMHEWQLADIYIALLSTGQK